MFGIKRNKGRIDKVILFSALLIAVLGIIFVYSATLDRTEEGSGISSIALKQFFWVLIGLFAMCLLMNMDYLKILDFAYLAYFINILFLVLLLLFGGERFGAKRWFSLGPFSFQPSEFIKLTVIFALASLLENRREKKGSISNFVLAILLTLPAFLFIFLQPDLGTSVVLVPILFAILFISGERIKYLLSVIMMAVCALPFAWHFLKDYQKSRLMVFINPNIDPLGAGYTIIQSKIAVGSGGLFGKGWLGGTQSHLRFLPERHTDFIFSVVGEEWGFIGGSILLLLYMIIIGRGLKIIANIEDVAGKVIATGIITLIAFQVIVNISMTIGFMPVVGLPLPAISYGGSNTIVTLMGIGLLLSVSRERDRWL